MKEKANDQERTTYNQLIIQKENEMDRMGEGRKEVEKSLYRLDEELHSGFRQLKELNQENAKEKQNEFFRIDQQNDDQERRFRQQIRAAQEEFNYAFQKEIHQMDDEREELYRKRGEIPWD
ncbi:hypothetical protein ACYRFS_07690 [Listeria kieliensis]|uniref:Uncharacterized protein n=1 Tax=Listeria kieliensis TaxID=1621700 RepID=A0A3D8TR98_9LIST|nr:hypothetical protein [Listeria kieliensis]RDX01222.1 hypothetical protein UR08_09810 [Listeria kieliensis]